MFSYACDTFLLKFRTSSVVFPIPAQGTIGGEGIVKNMIRVRSSSRIKRGQKMLFELRVDLHKNSYTEWDNPKKDDGLASKV
jgi:hypothetical protein